MWHYLSGILAGFRPADLFDMAIIACLLYGLLIWFRHTAARFVLVGIMLLGFVFVLSKHFHMYLTAVALQGFFAVLLVALVVIFQEELRRFFERIATWSVFRGKGASPVLARDTDIVIETVLRLAQKRVGALIVFPQSDPLGRHIEYGQELDGAVSAPLLESLFDHHSPGHDGAVIVQNGRVTHFGCHLPLSPNSQSFRLTGLRHTAALGLSERTDAWCVVVSEERGAISVAHAGRIRRVDDPNELKDMLDAMHAPVARTEKERGIRGWARRNTREKALAVGLACLLWLVFGQRTDVIRKDFTVPIEYRNASAGWVIREASEAQARLTLSGPEQAFRLLSPETLRISVDLGNLEEGVNDLVLSARQVRIPPDLTLESVNPGTVRVEAYRLVSARAPIELRTTGSVPGGYTLVSTTLVPSTASVLVPSNTDMDSLKLSTEPVNLAGLRTTTTVRPKLLYPADLRFAAGQPPDVQVTVRIEEPPATAPAPESSAPATQPSGDAAVE